MPAKVTYTPRTRRWEAVLLAFSLILGLTVAATTPAIATAVVANDDSYTTPKDTGLTTHSPSTGESLSLNSSFFVGAANSSGNIYANHPFDGMTIYNNAGTELSTWPSNSLAHYILDMEFDSVGNVYVIEPTGNDYTTERKVRKFGASDLRGE